MSNFTSAITDIRTGGLYTAAKMAGIGTGVWDKFLFDGGTSLGEKPGDFDITSQAAINSKFNNQTHASDYMTNVTSQANGAAKAAIKAKLKSDVMASMQQAVGLRYSSRIRHMMAAASRLRSIGTGDAEVIRLRTENV